VQAHTELILKASEMEEKRAKEEDRLKEVKARIGRAIVVSGTGEGGVDGMIVDEGVGHDMQEEVIGEEVLPAKKMPERKTKQQRAKAARLRAEVGPTAPVYSSHSY